MINSTLPPPLAKVLGILTADGERYFGHPAIEIQPLELADREAGQVMRAQVKIAGRSDRSIFVKAFKTRGRLPEDRRFMRARVTNDYAVTSRVYESFRDRSDFSAVKPIACFPDDLVLVTEAAPGEPFHQLLERCAIWQPDSGTLDELTQTAGRVGAWLRTFQSIEHLQRRISIDGMREYLDFRLRRLVESPKGAFSQRRRAAVLSYFDALSRNVGAADLIEVLVHGDVCPSNVLVDGRRIVMLDFAMACTGGMYLDVARLFTQFEFLKFKPKFRPHVVARLQASLLSGFDPALRPDHPLFQLFELRHVVCHVTNLSLNPAPPVARLYNRYQLHRHHKWLRQRAA